MENGQNSRYKKETKRKQITPKTIPDLFSNAKLTRIHPVLRETIASAKRDEIVAAAAALHYARLVIQFDCLVFDTFSRYSETDSCLSKGNRAHISYVLETHLAQQFSTCQGITSLYMGVPRFFS